MPTTQPVQPVHVPPPCPAGNVQIRLTTAKIGAPVGSDGGIGGYQARAVDMKVTVTNRTDGNIDLPGIFGPRVWGYPYTMGKNQMVFFTEPPSGSPTTMTLKPGQSFVYAYSNPSYPQSGFVWLGITDLRIESSWPIYYASDSLRVGCNPSATTVTSDPIPVSLR